MCFDLQARVDGCIIQGRGSKPMPKHIPIVSYVLDDGTLIETVYDGTTTALAIFKNNTWSIEKKLDQHIPYKATNNLIRHQVILFPSRPLEYQSEADLFDEIRWYIHRYVDIAPDFEQISSAYVLLTWLYDRFNELPYLRLKGDYGTGKTRFLLTIGSICYKPTFASGASTVSPLFHLLNTFKGTLIIDEADFRFSDEKAQIVKILNNGNVKGMPVLRTRQTRDGEYDPRAFQVFGPKIVATRGNYQDRALESRFLTEEMGTTPFRKDIPISLPESQEQEALMLRNKLLLFRFRNFHKTKVQPHFFRGDVEPRIKQIVAPLISISNDLDLQHLLEERAVSISEQIQADRGFEIEAKLLACIQESDHTIKEVTTEFMRRYGDEYPTISNRWIGGMIRKKLGLRTRKTSGVYVIPPEEEPKLRVLYEKYGVDEDLRIEPVENAVK